jgi:hypothetical protein
VSAAPAQALTVEWRPTSGLRAHEHARLLPTLQDAAFQSFRDDIAQRGITSPLEITSEGIVLDGRERLRAACELGLERLPVLVINPVDQVEQGAQPPRIAAVLNAWPDCSPRPRPTARLGARSAPAAPLAKA